MGLLKYWPLAWRSTLEAVQAEMTMQIAELTVRLNSAERDRDSAARFYAEARRDEANAHAERQKTDEALATSLRRHAEDLRTAALRQSNLEDKFMKSVADLEEARQECQRWADATRNGAGDPDLVVPRRHTRKPTPQDVKKPKKNRRKKTGDKE